PFSAGNTAAAWAFLPTSRWESFVSVTADRTHHRVLSRVHPLHAVLLAGTIPLFLGALLSDIAYLASYEIQWSNFASWLITGGLLFAGLAVLWAVADLFRAEGRHWRGISYVLLLLATWILGFINVLIHARD